MFMSCLLLQDDVFLLNGYIDVLKSGGFLLYCKKMDSYHILLYYEVNYYYIVRRGEQLSRIHTIMNLGLAGLTFIGIECFWHPRSL